LLGIVRQLGGGADVDVAVAAVYFPRLVIGKGDRGWVGGTELRLGDTAGLVEGKTWTRPLIRPEPISGIEVPIGV
jgi:hypothetical protein